MYICIWSSDNCSLLITKRNKIGAKSMNKLPKAMKRCTARHANKFGSRSSKPAYLEEKN